MVIRSATPTSAAPPVADSNIIAPPPPQSPAADTAPPPEDVVEISDEARIRGRGSAVSQAVHAAKLAREDGQKLGPLVSAAAREANGSLPPPPAPAEEPPVEDPPVPDPSSGYPVVDDPAPGPTDPPPVGGDVTDPTPVNADSVSEPAGGLSAGTDTVSSEPQPTVITASTVWGLALTNDGLAGGNTSQFSGLSIQA